MAFKTITQHDLEEIDAVQRRGYPSDMHEDISLFAKILEQKDAAAFALYENAQIYGYILGYPTDKDRDSFQSGPQPCKQCDAFYLHDLCVDPAFQDQGVGQKLFHHFEENVKKKGYSTMIAMAIDGRISFWEQLGFRGKDETTYLGMKATRVEKSL